MITISRLGNGYTVTLSWPGTGTRAQSVTAHNLGEIHSAIDHYYAAKEHTRPSDDCPLCRAMKK